MQEEGKFNQTKYINDFKRANYDRVIIEIPKGQREVWRSLAADEGKSLSAFIRELVEDYICKK